MEKNCLVTTYKATVNDNSLLKVGEMFIDIIEQASPTNQTNRLYLNANGVEELVVEVEDGAANLTLDEGMASGWTNKITIPKDFNPAPIFVRNGNYRLKVASKYNLYELGRYTSLITQKAISVDTKNLKYSHDLVNLLVCLSGNLANISGCTKLIRLSNLNNPNLEGSLSALAPLTALILLDLSNSTKITGSLSALAPLTALKQLVLSQLTNITGSLSSLAPLTALTSLILSQLTNITGSLSDLAPLTALTSLNLFRLTNITGSLSDLAPLTALKQLNLSNSTKITGDIKDIRQPLTSLSITNTNITGELIEFVKTQRAEGRTTGSCGNGGWWGTKVTFNGTIAGSKSPITWTENTITLGDVTVEQ